MTDTMYGEMNGSTFQCFWEKALPELWHMQLGLRQVVSSLTVHYCRLVNCLLAPVAHARVCSTPHNLDTSLVGSK